MSIDTPISSISSVSVTDACFLRFHRTDIQHLESIHNNPEFEKTYVLFVDNFSFEIGAFLKEYGCGVVWRFSDFEDKEVGKVRIYIVLEGFLMYFRT